MTNITTLAPQGTQRARDIALQRLEQQRLMGLPNTPLVLDPPVYGYAQSPQGSVVRNVSPFRQWVHQRRDWLNWLVMTLGLAGFIAWRARP